MLDKIFSKIEKFMPEKWFHVLNHEGFKRYFANTGWMFFGQMFSLLVSFFIGAWIARYLGPEKYGLVSYVVAFVGLFGFVSTLGTDGILNRELVSHPEKRDELMGTGFRIRMIGGVLAFLISTIAAFILGENSYTRALIIMFGVSFLLQAPYIINIFFYSQVKAKENIKAQVISAVISSILKIILILSGGGVIWLLVVFVADSIWQGILLFFFYQAQGFSFLRWKFKKDLAKEIWRDSWPLMLSSAAAFIYLKIDQVMVGKIMGDSAVGIYAAGVKITEIFYFLPGIICGSLFPAIVNARNTNKDLYYRRLKNFYFLLGSLGFLVAAPIAFFAKPIISIIFGSEYLAAIPVLQIYIWSSIGLFLAAAAGQQLMAENRSKDIFLVNFISMIINVGLNFILIPKLGIIGAAVATLITYFVTPTWMLFLKRKNI
ncbi:MAG: flippase [Patescibacteria group bacterium]